MWVQERKCRVLFGPVFSFFFQWPFSWIYANNVSFCLLSRFLMNSIKHPFSFLQYAKQLILNYFFHSVAWLFYIMEGGLVALYNQKTTHIIRKKKLFSLLKNKANSVILCFHTYLIPWCSGKLNFQICNISSVLWVWLIIIVSPLKWIMMIPKELVVNIINSWLYFQDINQKSKLLEMTRFSQMLLISKGIEVVWQRFLMLLSAWLYHSFKSPQCDVFSQVLLNQ